MATLGLARLVNRKVLKISGPDCYPYLQGLICNDLRYLYDADRIPKRKHARNSHNVLNTFMLNAQGRAICDLTIYRTPYTREKCVFTPPGKATDPDELLIDCDAKLASGIANTLFGYRVRRKITISMEDNLHVWSLIHKHDSNQTNLPTRTQQDNRIIDIGSSLSNEIVKSNMIVVNDPRISALGLRIITDNPDFNQLKKALTHLIDNEIDSISSREYSLLRYTLGVGEGHKDHPESNCLPLECNADFLGSVSFSKGCYLGQELTARIHYTGVVRKRLMPILVARSSAVDGSIPLLDNSDIIDPTSKKKIGVLRNVVKNRGLALLRCDLAANSETLLHEGSKTELTTYIPHWWDMK